MALAFESMKFEGLTEKGVKKYSHAKLSTVPFLKNQIIKPFEDALKEYTGYTDTNIPSEVKETEVECSTIPGGRFIITTKPTTKRPGYGNLYTEIQNTFLQHSISGNSLIYIKHFLDKIADFREIILSRGVEQKIAPDYEDIDKGLEKAVVSIIKDPKEAIHIPAKGLMYLEAGIICANNSEYISDFEKALKEEAGISKELKEIRLVEKQIGDALFVMRGTPYESMQYGQICNTFIEELGVLCGEKPELPKTEKAKAKALAAYEEMNKKVSEIYPLAKKDGRLSVPLENLVKRFEDLKKEFTKDDVDISVNFYPFWG